MYIAYLTVVLICKSPATNDVENFLYVYFISVCFLWWGVWSDLLLILKLVYLSFLLSCKSYLYILDVRPLSDIWFTNIFPYCGNLPFIDLFFPIVGVFRLLSFETQTFLLLMNSNCFSFVICIFGIISKKILSNLYFILTVLQFYLLGLLPVLN